MNITTFFNTLAFFLSKYFPEQLDPSLKPKDSSGCRECRNIKFDFIIVGAGTAGCVVANRLSANPRWNVLLIEAGGNEDYITDTPAILAYNFPFSITDYDWNYTTIRQQNACLGAQGGICPYYRGHIMGGSSAINFMMFVRGNQDDYNLWEEMGNSGWNYENVLHYFRKLENMTIPELAKSPFHSTNGPVSVSYPEYNSTLAQELLKAALQLGLPEVDYNGATQYGTAYTQLILRGPTRCSSSKAYIDPIRNRPNLHIFMNTMVTKILFSEGTPRRVIGVSCMNNGEEFNVYASKEVILSAGSINTPKLLMLSGVGPSEHLASLGIPVYADLPGVGSNLIDHSGVSLFFSSNITELNYSDPEKANDAIHEYAKCRSGILTAPSILTTMFLNSTGNQIDTLVIGAIVLNGFTGNTSGIAFFILNVNPKSVGYVRLNSSNFQDQPLINPNFLEQNIDFVPVRYGMRRVFEIVETKLMKYSLQLNYDAMPNCKQSGPLTDNILDCIIRYSSGPVAFHAVRTAKMGEINDPSTVVDSTLKVHTIDNLRVVDASVMPSLPTGNPTAPVYMVGEKASDIIKNIYYT